MKNDDDREEALLKEYVTKFKWGAGIGLFLAIIFLFFANGVTFLRALGVLTIVPLVVGFNFCCYTYSVNLKIRK